ncbi:MAG: restriction endonuclease subunit S [bacterium]
MQISITKYRSLNEEFRIDAEYYKPENLTSESLVTRKPNESLGQLCKIISGPFGSTVTTECYVEQKKYRYIRGKDIQNFFIDNTDPVYIGDKLFNTLPQFHLYPLDILVTVVGMNFGKTAIIFSNDAPAIFSCKSSLIRQSKINVFFLATYLSCKYGYNLVRRGQRGAAQPGINLFDLQTIPVPLFEKSFLKLIEYLVIQAREITINSKLKYNEAEQILLAELNLLDWKPKHNLSFIRNFSDTQKADRIDAEYFQPMYEEIDRAITSLNKFSNLGDIVSIKKCVEPGSESYQDSGILFLRVSNLSKFGIKDSNPQYLSESLYKQLSQYQPKKGEILLSKDATPGIAYYLKDEPEKMIPSGGILRLKMNDVEKVCPEYLTLVLNSILVQKQIERDAGGSIINHWLVDQVKNTLIPILSITKQKEIAQKINASFCDRELSKNLLEIAKHGVELAIEKDENEAEKWINSELKKLNISLEDHDKCPAIEV